MDKTISAKDLRTTLPEVVRRVSKGQRFLVLYRSRPAFRIVPVSARDVERLPLEEDPLYRAGSLVRSDDGLTAEDADSVVYGIPRK